MVSASERNLPTRPRRIALVPLAPSSAGRKVRFATLIQAVLPDLRRLVFLVSHLRSRSPSSLDPPLLHVCSQVSANPMRVLPSFLSLLEEHVRSIISVQVIRCVEMGHATTTE
jgi:hypothetical protein